MPNNLIYIEVFESGTYYNPANKHYDYKGSVNCDRCKKTNIKICIGYKTYDLCFNCVQDIEKIEKAINESSKKFKQIFDKFKVEHPKDNSYTDSYTDPCIDSECQSLMCGSLFSIDDY